MKIFTKLDRLTLTELIFLILILACSSSFAAAPTTYYVRTDGNDANSGTSNTAGGAFKTISHAISIASAGDTLQVANGNYSENVLINKSLTLNGQNSDTTLIAGSLIISSSTVTVSNIQFKDSLGIAVGTGLSSITFTNVKSDSSLGDGAVFNSVSGLSISNSNFSYNTNTGLKILSCSNVTLTNVTAASNGRGGVANGNGISIYGVATASVTNANASSNARHGLSISASGNSNITISGGTFNSNGTSPQGLDGSGGGINVYANSFTVSGVTVNGTVLADSNKTAGILLFSENSSSNITDVTVSGSVTLAGNGGAGAVVYGKSNNINLSAAFNRTTVSGAAGVLIVGQDNTGSNSPTGVTISNSTFTGYDSTTASYAISLGGTVTGNTRISTSPVTATSGNNFGTTDNFEIEKLIHHKVDDNSLGLVSWVSNNIYIPSNMSIQSGIGAASSGNTINVQSGTYTQNLTIDKNVILQAFAPPYAVISPASGNCITVNSPASTAAIHGFDLNPVSGSFGIKNTTSSTVDGTNNWWRTTSSDTIQTKISNTGGGSVTFDPFYGKATNNTITNSSLNSPITFSNSNASLKFTYLPNNTNATISLSQTPTVPTGLPPVPPSLGSANPVYLTITATGLTNGTFFVTIVLDVSNISGFGPNSKVVFFNSTTNSWELVNGIYDGTAHTFTFETNHFTTFGFLTSGTFVYDITMGNIVTNTGATVAVPVKLNTNGNSGFNQFQAKFTYPGNKLDFVSGNIGTGTLMNSKGWIAFFQAKVGSGGIDTVKVIGVAISPTTGNGSDVFFKLNFKIVDTSSGSDSIRGNTRDFFANGVDSVFLIAHNTITYTTGSSTARGDATLDGLVNIDDVNAIIDHLNGTALLTGQAFINAAAADNDTTSLSVNDITYILYYISHGNTWPSSPLSINPNTEANVTFTNAAQSSEGIYKLLNLPVNISTGSKVVNNLEMIVKFDQSQLNYQYFLQDQSTLLNGNVNNIIVDARNQGVMATNLNNGEVRFLFASSDPQQNIIPGKIIFTIFGNSPVVTSRYRINNEAAFHDGPKYGVTAVDNSGNNIPTEFNVSQNYPNPFNPSTIIRYDLPQASLVSIKIYNILGQEVKTLESGDKAAGTYRIQWNGDDNYGNKVSSGAYIYRIVAGSFVQVRKMVLMK